ncbi:hypothetical protein AA0Y32_08055 [Georgenia phoenicis]|uniref:hypothetical protein n=1 Tax=unclassified Georgenia TaxID=2626815 RepID=UPI0039B0846B
MSSEIQLISDGDGLAVIGAAGAVERFLISEGLPASKDLGLQRLGPKLRGAAGLTQAGSEIAASSGRWVKLTEESAQNLSKYNLMKGSSSDVSRAVFTNHHERHHRPDGDREARCGWSQSRSYGGRRWPHGAAGHAADHGRDHRLPEDDRREAR